MVDRLDTMTDGLDPIDESLGQLLAAEKACPDPAPDTRLRTMARLSATLGLAGDLGQVPPASIPAAPLATPHGPSLASGLVRGSHRAWATFLLGAAVGATAYGTVSYTVSHLRQDPRQATQPSAAAAISPSPAQAAPEPAAAPAPEPSPVSATRPMAPAPSTGRATGEPVVGVSRDVGLAAERNLIEIARTALARGRVDDTLATLRRHARQFPRGQLGEERDSLFVQALVAKGDHAQARERAARFRRQHPSSLFLPAVEQASRSIP